MFLLFATVPEPTTAVLMLAGFIAVMLYNRAGRG